ncbi:conditioned medium-induced protein 4 [Halomicrobium urmianum]|uniref:conditioned medium-induced protein 4 n=1 Tax=Halomicrobium urmianum TaxID=1586233 RepID=UPI001CD9F30E|nr:conditioned medium-induced protein 4 [Halomicrobium urmianum]
MDEKTEELRDIFVDVSGEETVTESQEDDRGTLAGDEEGVEQRLSDAIDGLRERFPFEVDLGEEALVTVVRRFYDGDDDAAIAEEVGADPADVFAARMDLHLFREDEADLPVDFGELRDLLDAGADDEAVADEFGVSTDEAGRYRRVVRARDEARSVSYRFQSEYEDALTDAGLAATMTETIRDDGLREATEDIGSLEEDADVDF